MSNTVLIKRSGTSSVTPTSLQSGEIAINYADGKLFYKNSSNTIVGAKLITGISGTANQVSVSETSGAFTISLPSSVYVNSLFVDNIEIDTTGATPNHVLAFNGTKFVPTASGGSLANLTDVSLTSPQTGEILRYDGSNWVNNLETGYNNSYAQIVGDGSSSTFVINHNFGTRDIFVQCRNNSSPYENINVRWEATTADTVTLDFSTVPASNSIRVNIYASVGVTGPSAYAQTIGNGSSTSYTIDHNLQTRDIVVAARNTASPYEVIEVNWQATNDNQITVLFSTPPSNNSTRIIVYAAAGVAGVTSLNGTANEVEVSQTTGSITVGLPNNVTVSGQLSSSSLFVDSIEIDTTGATPNQFLKFNGTKFAPADIPTINTLDDVGDVTITSATPDQFLKWNGSAWVNANIPQINTLDDVGDVALDTPAVDQVLVYDGSNWVNGNINAIAGTSYLQTIGNGSATSFTLTHNLGTRDVFVVFRQATSPYDILNVYWEATTTNTITAIFDSAPALNSVRALIYAGFSTAQGTSYSANVGNGSATEITVTHNLGTRDVLVSCRSNNSPYNDIQVSWEALTTNTVKLYFGEAPDSNEVRVNIFSNAAGGEVAQSVNSLTDTDINSPSNGQLLVWNGSNWINDTLVTVTALDGLTDVVITSATPDQFLKWDGSSWVNASIPQINNLNDVGDVTISSATSGQLLKWNGSAWVNSDTVQNLIVSGDLTVNGTTTTISTTELLIEDNLIVLNTGSAATPSFNAGIEVERGNFTNVQIRWNETTDKWQFTNDGSTYKDLGSGGVTVSDTIPSSPAQGDMWYESDTGALFAYYDSQWIEIGGSAAYNEIIGTIQAKGDLLAGSASQSLTRLGVGSNGTRLAADPTTTTGLAWVSDAQNSVIDAKGDLLVGLSDNTVGKLTVGTNGQILVADSSQTAGVGWTEINTRNLLYNGAMQVHQRGTSTASITTANYYTADRWKTDLGAFGTWTQSVENDAPTGSGFRKSLRMLCTTADASPAAGDYGIVEQQLEGQDCQLIRKGTSSAQQLTLSFWVKANVTGTYICFLQDLDNNRSVSLTYTISASATWEQKTLVFPADTTGALDNDNASSLMVRFVLGAGTNWTSGTRNQTWASLTLANLAQGQTANVASAINNYWQITGVQLNVGPVAASFEFKSYERELRECQRYYYRITSSSNAFTRFSLGQVYSATQVLGFVSYPVTMRTAPTAIEQTGTASNYGAFNSVASTQACTAVPIHNVASENGATFVFTVGSGTVTAGNASTTVSNNTTSAYLAWSADL